jgi:DNA-directed RNA polymerase specialized sigma24 family protein
MTWLEEKKFAKFTDEFGEIDGDVYAWAVTLKPRVEGYALRVLGDAATGQRLLMKACALVTRRLKVESPANLSGYLYRTWQRLLLAELEKENGHRQLEADHFAQTPTAKLSSEELDRRILLQQVIQHMDGWTRRVFEYLTLGFTYDEIALHLGGNGHAIRVKYDRQIKAIAQRVNPPGRSP